MEQSLTAKSDAASTVLLQGWWRLLSSEVEFRDSHEREPMYGVPAQGYLIFTPEGRMMAYVEACGRKAPTTDKERAGAYHSMAAYSGRYRVEGDRWITSVDVAWNADWLGTEQDRRFLLQSDELFVVSPWYSSPLHADRVVCAHLHWARP